MKISNSLYTYPVLSNTGMRDDYSELSDFSVCIEKVQTGVTEASLDVSVHLADESLQKLVEAGSAQIICHVESSLSSFRDIIRVNSFDMRTLVPIDPAVMRGILDVTVFIVASNDINDFRSTTFGEFYAGTYDIEAGNILAFAPTVEIEIEPDDIDKGPTQSIVKVKPSDKREMVVDLTGEYIIIYLPQGVCSAYKSLAYKESAHYKISMMAVIMPALMDAVSEVKHDEGGSDNKIWSRVIKARLKAGGRGTDVTMFDPLANAQFLLNSPVDGMFEPIIERFYGGDE